MSVVEEIKKPKADELVAEIAGYGIKNTVIQIQSRGFHTWAVVALKRCMNREGDWEYEPQPRGRDKDFLQRTRFSSASEAVDMLKYHWAKVEADIRFFILEDFNIDRP